MPSVRVRAFAKLNLSLEVLHRRADGYHDLRTIFQTISLADTIDIDAEIARRTDVELSANVEIPGENLVTRAAQEVLQATGKKARLRFRLRKKIPLGGGLGGGSTDAAAVLLALPGLLGKPLPYERLMEIGASLGSDVPFFLLGGTALGLGRGTELYPLADTPAAPALVVAPGVHVSTAEAYAALGRGGTESPARATRPTERLVAAMASGEALERWRCVNDFEEVVLARHPEIAAVKRRMQRAGAKVSMMTGSGAAVFGLFGSRGERDAAAASFEPSRTFRVEFVSRRQYRRAWQKSN